MLNQKKIIKHIKNNVSLFLIFYRTAFCQLFDLTPNQYSIIEFLLILKPEIPCNIKDQEKIDEILNQKNVNKQLNIFYNFFYKIKKRKHYIDQIVELGISLSDEEKNQLEIIMIMSNQSLPHLVDFLSELNSKRNVNLILFKILINLYSIFQQINKIKTLNDQSITGISSEELILVLQSILLTKFSIRVNWKTIHDKINQNYNNLNRQNKDLIGNYQERIFQMTEGILQSFDILYDIYLTSLFEKSDYDEIKSQMSPSLKNQKQGLNLIKIYKQYFFDQGQLIILQSIIQNYKRLRQTQKFNLNFYKALEKETKHNPDIGYQSLSILRFLIESHGLCMKQLNKKQLTIEDRFLKPEENFNNEQDLENNQSVSKITCQKFTSFICGVPFFILSKRNKLMKIMDNASQLFIIQNKQGIIDQILDEKDNDKIHNFEKLIENLNQKVLQLYYLSYHSGQQSLVNKQKLNKCFVKLLTSITRIKLDEKWELSLPQNLNEKENQFIQKVISIYIEQPQIFPYEQIKDKNIFNKLSVLLNRSVINLKDETVVKELISLLMSISREYIDQKMVKNLIQLIIKNEHSCLLQMVKDSKVLSDRNFEYVNLAVKKISELSIFKPKKEIKEASTIQQQKQEPSLMRDVLKNVKEGKVKLQILIKIFKNIKLIKQISVKDVFISIDSQGDGNGLISLSEFCNFISRTGIQMSEHRTNELFATIKKNRKNKDNTDNTQLNYEEFEKAFNYLKKKKADMSLQNLGISPALLAISLGTLIVILVLLLVFIFLGIKAFALGGTFGSIINSIIPMVATSGTAQAQSDKKESLKEDHIQDAVKETEEVIDSNKL